MTTLLVVGARDRSLGWHVTNAARASGIEVMTAGINGEQLKFNSREAGNASAIMRATKPANIVCTIGINRPRAFMHSGTIIDMMDHIEVNTFGPIKLLRAWLDYWISEGAVRPKSVPLVPRHFVVISSNSAQIARTNSIGYCASKAALSMSIRVVAREMADYPLNIYGYEPGWLKGTPMSEEINRQLKGAKAHRIPGGERREIDPQLLARTILNNLNDPISSFHGEMIRVDGGEQ